MSFKISISIALLTIALTGCLTTKPGEAPLTQHQKIAAACVDAAAAAEAIATAVDAGKVSKENGRKAATLYHTTDKWCEPPVESISASNYSQLLSALASLVLTSGVAK